MSFLDLHMTNSPLIIKPDTDSDPVAVIFGVPFDSTHSYKPGCRFGPDSIRDAFNNIEIFQPEFGVDLETVNINDLGNTKHTVVATEMLQMVENITTELRKQNQQMGMFIKNMGNAKTVLQVDGRQLAETVGSNMYDMNQGV